MEFTKKAEKQENFSRAFVPFPSARAGFKFFLSALPTENKKIAIPAYIGVSPKEGSGVLDPIIESGFVPVFYKLDKNLSIDFDFFAKVVDRSKPSVVLFIHFFGFVDPVFEKACSFAGKKGIFTVEDEAHSLFTDVVGGKCGRLGDIALISLHKMLPFQTGGGVFVNNPAAFPHEISQNGKTPWNYDLWKIAKRRRNNSFALKAVVESNKDLFEVFPRDFEEGEVPQTFPVILKKGNRDKIYERLNGKGIGVVSLYHTLIPEISAKEFPQEHRISRTILNLPIHQDLTPERVTEMGLKIVEALRED